MKKNDWILSATVLLYSYLFYQQTAGINFLLFNVALVLGLSIKDKLLLKNKNWWIAAIGAIATSACIAYYGNTLSIVANIISLSLLSALSFSNKSSVVFSLVYSFYSYASAAAYIVIDYTERRKASESNKNTKSAKTAILIAIPVLITLVFFQMYRASNPLFNDFAKKINFDFISFGWIFFTLGGLVLLYGFFYHHKINSIANVDDNAPRNIAPIHESSVTIFGKQINLLDENFSGKVLFIMLNALLLIVNLLDINFMFIDHKLPKGIGYSEFVHQGTEAIITSIVIAIIIILYYFRGAINFYERSRTIKLLAYCWILQNVFMLLSTSMRNNLYITECGLTYKRIGVYIYLILSAIGLLTTFIKIMKIKSNNYLFRVNGWIFYAVLVVSCFFSWDTIITNYNISGPKQIEKNYLTKLSFSNLPLLYANSDLIKIKKDDTVKTVEDNDSYYSELNLKKSSVDYNKNISRKLYTFMMETDSLQWQSWNVAKANVHKDLVALNDEGKIKSIDLSNTNISSLIPIKDFDKVSILNLAYNKTNIDELQYFSSLKKLNLANNKLNKIDGIEKLKQLEYLDLSDNVISDYRPLFGLKNLKELHVSNTLEAEVVDELQENLPNTQIWGGKKREYTSTTNKVVEENQIAKNN